MKNYLKIMFAAFAAVLLVSCAGKSEIKLIPEANFDENIDGKPVGLYTLKAGDLTMQVTNFGARVVSLWTPDKNGNYDDIVLGYNNIATYVDNPGERFLGAVVGPYANRIAGGTMEIDGETYALPQNNNGQTLHGGLKGLDMAVWDVVAADDSTILFKYVHPDGLDGYPGNIDIMMAYSLNSDNEFKISYVAETDKKTFVNISHHSFFNLKGEGNGDILDNIMVINAGHTTPVDNLMIPSGEVADVAGTPFDFREPHTIGECIGADNEQLANGLGYDHNWVLDRKTDNGVEFAASVYEPGSGRFLEVFTDQPALQFYSGNFFDGTTCGKYGKALKYREALVLETQKYPDSPHHGNFPSTLLCPGETYTHTCVYRFSVK